MRVVALLGVRDDSKAGGLGGWGGVSYGRFPVENGQNHYTQTPYLLSHSAPPLVGGSHPKRGDYFPPRACLVWEKK